MLSSHLRLGLPSDSSPQVSLPPVSIAPHPIRATCPAHPILQYLPTWIMCGEDYLSGSSSIRNFTHSPVTSTFLGPNILRQHAIRKQPSAYVPLPVWWTKFPTHIKQKKIVVLYISIRTFFDSKLRRQKILHWMIASTPQVQSDLNVYINGILIC